MSTQYTLTLRSEPSAVPTAIRLRRLLKCVLRVYGFRCVAVNEHQSDAAAQPGTAASEARSSPALRVAPAGGASNGMADADMVTR